MEKEINDFLDFISRSRSRKTHTTYKAALQVFREKVGDDAPLTKQTYIKFLDLTTDVSPATQAIYRSAVRRLYGHVADTVGGIDISFFDMANDQYALRRGKHLIILNEDGIQKTLQYVNTIRNTPEELRDRTFILLMADSGLRVSEVCALRVGDIDLHERRAVIVAGKGDKDAIVKISERTREAIIEYLRTRYASQSTPLILRHDKRAGSSVAPVTPGYIWHYIKRRISEAGVDPKTIRIHDFRHYFVTVVYRAKGIKTAQVWARHESINTTNHYTHLVDDGGEAYDDVFNH